MAKELEPEEEDGTDVTPGGGTAGAGMVKRRVGGVRGSLFEGFDDDDMQLGGAGGIGGGGEEERGGVDDEEEYEKLLGMTGGVTEEAVPGKEEKRARRSGGLLDDFDEEEGCVPGTRMKVGGKKGYDPAHDYEPLQHLEDFEEEDENDIEGQDGDVYARGAQDSIVEEGLEEEEDRLMDIDDGAPKLSKADEENWKQTREQFAREISLVGTRPSAVLHLCTMRHLCIH